jgi:dihydropyrimidinase
MEITGELGALTCVHAENGPVLARNMAQNVAAGLTHPKYHRASRPAPVEGEATARAIRLSAMAGAPLFIAHVSAAEAVGAIAEARDRGLPVHGETCPHYLFLSEQAYEAPDFEAAKYVMSPPLRAEADQEALWRALANGDLAAVSTDHCPFNFSAATKGLEHSKELGRDSFAKIPNGAPGIETRIAMMYDGAVRQGRMGINRFVELIATGPAKLFGLFPAKGTIAVGSDGDLVLFDPDESWTVKAAEHHSDVDYSLFEGWRVTGRVKKVFLRGEMIVDGETWLGRAGLGRYLARGPSGQVS